ncbi:MAG: DHH family phosphoesterase [Erysipelotrichaceae bacterium]|nr:DHH family phosphoesterase [Erysipelotrichaceae bacterium]
MNKKEGSYAQRVCDLNNIDISDLDVSDFSIDKDIEVLNDFIRKLLSLRDKRFFIVGDYDCDGICATAIMKKLFDDLNISSNYYIPSRIKEGYGINNNIVDIAHEHGFDIIVTVDNGVVANEQLDYATSLGLQTFVIDHHEYQNEPECTAFIHPNLFDEKYSDMCAAGLCALISVSIRDDDTSIILGGMATMADMVSVLNYNRYLLKEMLRLLKKGDYQPVKYLLGRNELSYQSLQFNVIPKINAVSRLDDIMNVNYVVRYLLCKDESITNYYSKIETINDKRKELTQYQCRLAEKLINDEDTVCFIYSEEFNEGLCGLIANRLMYEVSKPVIVLSSKYGLLKGSGRSPVGFNIYDYLQDIKDMFITLGGHANAVGLSLSLDKVNDVLEYIRNHPVEVTEQTKDVLIFDQDEIDMDLYDQYEELSPYGSGFNEPLFAIENPFIDKKLTVAGKYPKYILGKNISAISFKSGNINRSFSTMIFRIQKDSYHKDGISLLIEDLIQF